MFTWILVANASEGRLFSSENLRTDSLKLIKSFDHQESRAKGADLMADRPGHYQTDHATRSSYEGTDPKGVEAEKFLQEMLADLLNGCCGHEYERLIFVLPAHLYGYIKKHFTCKKPGLQVVHFSKDYTSLSVDVLLERLREHLYSTK